MFGDAVIRTTNYADMRTTNVVWIVHGTAQVTFIAPTVTIARLEVRGAEKRRGKQKGCWLRVGDSSKLLRILFESLLDVYFRRYNF